MVAKVFRSVDASHSGYMLPLEWYNAKILPIPYLRAEEKSGSQWYKRVERLVRAVTQCTINRFVARKLPTRTATR